MLLLVLKQKNKLVYYLTGIAFLVLVNSAMLLIIEYCRVNPKIVAQQTVYSAVWIIYFLDSVLLFLFPKFNHQLVILKKKTFQNVLWALISFAMIVYFTIQLFFVQPELNELMNIRIGFIMMDLMFVYIGVLMAFQIKKIFDKELKKEIIIYIVGMSILLILTVFNYINLPQPAVFKKLKPETLFILRNFTGRNIFYLGANIFIIALITKYSKVRPFFIVPDKPNLEKKYVLTVREKEIIEGLIKGLTNKQVGEQLFISEYTVKTHVQNIYTKLGVRNRVELANMMKDKD